MEHLKISKLKTLLGLFMVGFVLIPTGCYYDKQDELYGEVTCDTSNVSYSRIKTVLEQQCYGCHTASAPSGNVAIYDYNSLIQYVQSSKSTLIGSIKHTTASPMPKGGQKWDACKIESLEAWINQGMKR